MPNIDIILTLIGAAAARQGLDDVAAGAGSIDDATRQAAEAADALRGRLEGIRNAGAVMAGIGAAGIAAARGLAQIAEEGNAAEQRLEAVLRQQGRLNDLQAINATIDDVAVRGHFDDDDSLRQATVLMANWEVSTQNMVPLLEAAGRQAQTTGQSVEELANAFGKAAATGNHEGLKRTAVSFNETELAALEAAKAIGGTHYQMVLTNAVAAAVGRTTGALGDSLTDSQKAANDAARAMDDMMTNLGTGAGKAEASIKRVVTGILTLGNEAKGAQEGAGALLVYGSYALSAVGGVMALGAQVGLLTLAMPGLKVAAIAAFTTLKVAAASTIPFLAGVASALAIPFAILTAGAAVGIAAYEALRAMNIGGFGDSHKSVAEIVSDTRKTLTGDPAAEAQAANKAALAGLPGLTGADMGAMGMGDGGAAVPVTPTSAAATFAGTATGALVSGGGDVEQLDREKDQIEDELRNATGKANTERRKVLTERKVLVGRQIEALRKGNAAEAKKAREEEQEARKRQRAADILAKQQIDDTQLLIDTEANTAHNQAAETIAALEIQKEEAEERKDKAKVAQLTYDIAVAQAEADRAQALIQARSTALENGKKAEQMEKQAQDDYDSKVRIAQLQLNRARSKGTAAIGDLMRRLTTNRPSTAGAGNALTAHLDRQFGPTRNGQFIGPYESVAEGAFARQSLGANLSNIFNAKQTGMTETSKGDRIFKFEVKVPNDLRHDVATIPGS